MSIKYGLDKLIWKKFEISVLSGRACFSLVSLKRCCKSVHQCLGANPDLEIKKYRQKIAADWSSGSHRDVSMSVSGLVSCADFFAPPHIRKVALGVDDKVHVCTVRESQGDGDNTNCDTVLPGQLFKRNSNSRALRALQHSLRCPVDGYGIRCHR